MPQTDDGLPGLASQTFDVVSKFASSNEKAEWLGTPLYYAAKNGDLGLVNKLIEQGTKWKAGSRHGGRTILHAAAFGGNKGVVLSLLLKAGCKAEVNVLSSAPKSLSPLYVAIDLGHEAVARQLVLAGADVNYKSPLKGLTLLHKAIMRKMHVAHALILRGADVSAETPEGWTPLHLAIDYGFTDLVVSLLMKGVEKDAAGPHGLTPLLFACHQHKPDLDIVETLLHAGADVNATNNPQRSTPLMLACHKGNQEAVEAVAVVEKLLVAGADVNMCDKSGESPLIYAACSGFVSSVTTLLEHRAIVNHQNIAGRSALHEAGGCNSAGAIDALINAGADINLKEFLKGQTPLNHAAENGNAESCLALLRHGANPNAKENSGDTPINIACFRQPANLEVTVDVLLRWGADETIADEDENTPKSSLDVYKDGGCSQDEIDRVKLLLDRAPADRAWRRRGWLVMLRARAPTNNSSGSKAKVSRPDDGATSGQEDVFRGAVDWLVGIGTAGVFRTVLQFL